MSRTRAVQLNDILLCEYIMYVHMYMTLYIYTCNYTRTCIYNVLSCDLLRDSLLIEENKEVGNKAQEEDDEGDNQTHSWRVEPHTTIEIYRVRTSHYLLLYIGKFRGKSVASSPGPPSAQMFSELWPLNPRTKVNTRNNCIRAEERLGTRLVNQYWQGKNFIIGKKSPSIILV